MYDVSRRDFCRRTLTVGAALAAGAPMLFSQRAQAAPNWVDQRQVGPFVCQADFPLVDHEELLAELAPLEQELRRVLALQPCRSPVYLHLLANQQRHEAYIAERFPGVPYRRALFVKQDGRASVFAFLHEELADDVRHECTHALLHADLPMIPLWLDEGLAEYFEVARDKRAQEHPHLRALRWDLRLGMIPDMASLEAKTRLEDLTARDYRYAWAWTHYLLHGPVAAHAELVAYLSDIRRHEAPGLLSSRLERIVPNPTEQLVRHFKQLGRG